MITFFVFLALIIAGFIIRGLTNMLPEPSFSNPIYDDYQYLITWLTALSILFQNISLALFILSTFLGAVTDRSLSKQVRTGLAIAAGIGILALIVLGGSLQVIWVI